MGPCLVLAYGDVGVSVYDREISCLFSLVRYHMNVRILFFPKKDS